MFFILITNYSERRFEKKVGHFASEFEIITHLIKYTAPALALMDIV